MDIYKELDMLNLTVYGYDISDLLNTHGFNEEEAADYDRIYSVAVYINNYYLWIIFAFGFPGNIASTFTLSQMKPLTTSKFYVALLAIIDNLAIVQKLLFHQLSYYEVPIGTVGCRIMNYSFLCPVTYSNWILVFMAIERFMAVSFPLRVSVIWNVNRARLSMIILAVVILGIYSHTLFTTLSVDGIHCGIGEKYSDFYAKYWYWINACIYSFLPSVILIVCNVMIIYKIRKSAHRRSQLYSETDMDRTNHRSKYDRQITVMLLTVAMVFLVLTLPRTIYVLFHLSWQPPRLSIDFARKYLLDQVSFFLCDATHAVNFYLYFITGQKFRQSFIDATFRRRARNSSFAFSHSRIQTTHNGTAETTALNPNSQTCKACVHMNTREHIQMEPLIRPSS